MVEYILFALVVEVIAGLFSAYLRIKQGLSDNQSLAVGGLLIIVIHVAARSHLL